LTPSIFQVISGAAAITADNIHLEALLNLSYEIGVQEHSGRRILKRQDTLKFHGTRLAKRKRASRQAEMRFPKVPNSVLDVSSKCVAEMNATNFSHPSQPLLDFNSEDNISGLPQ